MSPEQQARGRKAPVFNNLYTIILAVAVGAVIATAAFVAYNCYFLYGTLFRIP